MKCTFGLDVGGTKISTVLLDETGIVLDYSTVPTAKPGASVIGQISALVATASEHHPLSGVGVAVPGDVDPAGGVVRKAPNIGWTDIDLYEELRQPLPDYIYLLAHNDANAAAWAEYRFGGHGASDSLAMITVGTGIGGGFVLNGQLLTGASGAAGEVGHLTFMPEGELCTCGTRGCWERYASGGALQRAAASAGWPSETASHDVLASAANNPDARSVVMRIARHLVQGIGMVAAALDPSHVLLGGGLGTDPRFLSVVQDVYAEFPITPPRCRPDIKAATLGPLAGAIGAADLARHHGLREAAHHV